ncbi:hypothetical protein [Roseiconus lacunae]|uniref:hypothetical protein n=1 Tax=Roseiconus lacunae TaxID=2605694 RepID=UPI001E2BCAB6|nr:hypothetical protein [Roseiconus lacunae]MCD0460073.1 hypothetical protein [Roseiconus lacunae]
MTEITITGTTGVGKTLYADGLARAAERAGLTIAVSDHELFTSHKKYQTHLASVRKRHEGSQVDLSVLVVNDGLPNLRVDFGGRVPYRIARAIFAGMQELAQ